MTWQPFLRERWMPWNWAWDLDHPYVRVTGPILWIKKPASEAQP